MLLAARLEKAEEKSPEPRPQENALHKLQITIQNKKVRISKFSTTVCPGQTTKSHPTTQVFRKAPQQETLTPHKSCFWAAPGGPEI